MSARRQVHKAQIVLDVGAKLACEVHNGSRSGATLRLNRAFDVPSWFRLHMQGGLTVGCTSSVGRRG